MNEIAWLVVDILLVVRMTLLDVFVYLSLVQVFITQPSTTRERRRQLRTAFTFVLFVMDLI
jgi:hypothetical protein